MLGGDRPEPSDSSLAAAGDGSFALLCGYLFDRTELARGLGADALDSAAGAVLSGYNKRGRGIFDLLRGGYLAAVWDGARQTLSVARDAIGLQPCFYFWKPPLLLLSGSLDEMLRRQEVAGGLNRVSLAEYVLDIPSPDHGEETLYEGICRLPPAHTLSLDRGRLSVERYWDPAPPGFAWASRDKVDALPSLLERSVARCLDAGADSIGLSGGLDSVGIAALAAARNARPLHALSLRFTDSRCDEGKTQHLVAKVLGMPQLLLTIEESLGGRNPVEAALELSGACPGPVVSVWQSMYSGLMGPGAALGLRRMLMGTGGDDLFSVDVSHGADRLAAGDLAAVWRFYRTWRHASPLPSLQVARAVLWRGALRRVLARGALASLGKAAPRYAHRLQLGRRRARLHQWLSGRDGELIAALESRLLSPNRGRAGSHETGYRRTIGSLLQPPRWLYELDQSFFWSRHHGFTLLCPYLDREVVELAVRMHPDNLIAGGVTKAPLRLLVQKRLPKVAMRRKKVDFTLMIHQVLRAHARTPWDRVSGRLALADLRIVNPDRIVPLIDDYFAGRNDRWLPTWLLLSTEDWVRARSGLPGATASGLG